MKQNVAIIGAGITGLTIGYYLKKNNIPFKIFEKSPQVGGVIQSIEKEGFLYEKGPNSGVLSNLELLQLFDELTERNLSVEIGNAAAKKRLIWKNNQWHALPSGLLSAIKTPLFSFSDKIKVLKEPFTKKGNNPNENLTEMVKRRLGNSFLDYAIDPFISGIYAGNTNELIPRFALPKLYQLEQDYGSFIKGAIKKAKEPKTTDEKRLTKDIFSFKSGLSSLPKILAEIIGNENLILSCGDLKIEQKEAEYTIQNETFTNVISSIHADSLPKIFSFVQPEEWKNIQNTKYAKIVSVAIGFKNWSGINLDAFGGLIPTKEHKNILGVLFMSTIFKNRAPQNGALLNVFIGGTQHPELTELSIPDLKKIIAKDVTEMLQMPQFEPDLFELTYYKKAIAQYDIKSEQRLKDIAKIEAKYPGILLAGSIRDGVGIADRVKQASTIAHQIISKK